MRPAEVRPAEVRSAEVRPAEVRPPEARPAEVRQKPEARPAEVRPPEARPPEARHAVRPADPTVPTNIYRARRSGVAAVLIVPAVAVGMLLLRALAISAFGTPFRIGGVLSSSLGLAALPLLVAGLYGLITGAAYGAEQWGFKVWARPPLAYLVVGIAFAVAAGIAAP